MYIFGTSDVWLKILDKVEIISVEKFRFSQILLGDKNATSLYSKNISTLHTSIRKLRHEHANLTTCIQGVPCIDSERKF